MDTRSNKILFRTDANEEIGLGHLMRCSALAGAFQELGSQSVFLLGPYGCKFMAPQPGLIDFECLVSNELPGSIADADYTGSTARQIGASLVVVDGYQFNPAFQKRLHSQVNHLTIIDDYHHFTEYIADLILNQNPGILESDYLVPSKCRFLLGPRYALLRKDFGTTKQNPSKIHQNVERILVSMGGSDTLNCTLPILTKLHKLLPSEIEIVCLVGIFNRKSEDIISFSRTNKCRKISVYVQPTNIVEVLASADFAIIAAGSTCWELCLLGIPFLTVTVAANQRNIASQLEALGASRNLGNWNTLHSRVFESTLLNSLIDFKQRLNMQVQGMKLVDGLGAKRVARELLEESNIKST